MLNRYKWYRRLRGGVWYENRYIYDSGRVCFYRWERVRGTNSGYSFYCVDTEDYRDDPVKHCELYKKEGCSHVDGYLCDFKTCKMRIDYDNNRNNNIN